MVIILLS